MHNLNNENNIALSPYGTVSILTALLEGVQGSAQHEIQTCGGFPANRDIVRIGLRDIHRLLRVSKCKENILEINGKIQLT